MATLKAKPGDFRFEYMTFADVRKNPDASTPDFVVDWLYNKNIFFILSQGIHPAAFEIWKCWECRTAVLRLVDRIGFPSGINLKCPVWNGDKMTYLQLVGEITNPSIAFPFDLEPETVEFDNAITTVAS